MPDDEKDKTKSGANMDWDRVIDGMTVEERERMIRKAEGEIEKTLGGGARVSGIFGTGPRITGGGGGSIHVEGAGAERAVDLSSYMSQLVKAAEEAFIKPSYIEEVDGDSTTDLVASNLLRMLAYVWEHPLDWQFMVSYNPGQSSFWFTAKFYDSEEDLCLVEGTLVVTEEELLEVDNPTTVERKIEQLHDKLVADLAAFEEDS